MCQQSIVAGELNLILQRADARHFKGALCQSVAGGGRHIEVSAIHIQVPGDIERA